MSASDNLSHQFSEVRPQVGWDWHLTTNTETTGKVRLDNLIATQETYSPSIVDKYREGEKSPIRVYRSGNNRSYVTDGHHRAIAAKESGATHVDALVRQWKGPR